jgi:hypothetical protein
MTNRTAAALLVLAVTAAARAEDRRLEATRIDPQPVPPSAPEPAGAARTQLSRSSDSGDEHQLFHIGAMSGLVSLPRPVDIEAFIGVADWVQAGFSYSDFPNLIADPLLKIVGAASGGVSARLDEFTAWEGNVRVFPFRGSFYIGSSFGKQVLRGAVTESGQTATVDLSTLYATPRIGWQTTFGAGFFTGFDAGVQLKLSGTVNVTVPPGAPQSVQDSAQSLADAGSRYPLPSVHWRIGWMY